MTVKPIWLLAIVLLAGCTVAPPTEEDRPDAPPPEIGAPPPEAQEPPPPAVTIPPAVRELVRRGEAASAAGRQGEAAAYLERALHIAPENPALWQNLAVVRYRQGRYELAESLALRSNQAARDNPELELRNWTLIAAARRLAGDEEGARAAEQKAAALREVGAR